MTASAFPGTRPGAQAATLHAVVLGTTRLGPGNRAAVWFQGCPFRCPNCIAPDTLSAEGGSEMYVETLWQRIHAAGPFDGLTCSGGEPFAQPAALAALARKAKDHGLNVIVFSGYKYAALRTKGSRDNAVAAALDAVDVLIDGIYVDHLNEDTGMRGSRNQGIHFLSDRLRDHRSYFETYDKNAFELRPDALGDTALVGVPSKATGRLWQTL